jgi:uncharacterized protein YhfF
VEPLPSVEEISPRLQALGIRIPSGKVTVGSFGDSEALSEELLALMRAGRKRGGASLLWAHEFEQQAIPEVGDIEIVVNHRNEPVLVTRIVKVQVLPFNQVGADFAAREGEGDSSLTYWREAHWAYFGRECQRIGRTATETMPVVCASFEVLNVVPESQSV